jgi:hypothetical protein
MGYCSSALVLLQEVFSTPTLLQGIDKVIPVDVYVPGLPLKTGANCRWRNETTRIGKNRIRKKNPLSTRIIGLLSNNEMALENTDIQDKLVETFGENVFHFNQEKDIFSFEVAADKITAIILFLKRSTIAFNF